MFQNAAAYNAGRIISYTIIGGILGGIGAFTGMAGTLQTSSFFQGLLKLLAGALMVVMGINKPMIKGVLRLWEALLLFEIPFEASFCLPF